MPMKGIPGWFDLYDAVTRMNITFRHTILI